MWENGIYENKMACTMGEPITGDPPTMKIMLLTTPPLLLSVPLCFIAPVHPLSAKEHAVIIVGDDVGTEVVVVEAGDPLFRLRSTDKSKTLLYRPYNHLATRSKLRF